MKSSTWLFKVCHLHTDTTRSMAHFFILPTPTPLHPGAHRSVWKGGVKMEEGRVNRAGLNHVWLLKKEQGRGKTRSEEKQKGRGKILQNCLEREAQKQGEWETGVLEDNVDIQEGGRQTIQKPFSPLLWLRTDKQDYLMLIIETHAASDWDFQCWIYGNSQKVI